MAFSAERFFMGAFGDNYYSWMDRQIAAEKSVMDHGIKDALAYSLESGDVTVFDSMPTIRDDIFGKRKRGRPRKEEETSGKNEGFAENALKEERKEKARKLDRLNPQPTERMKHLQEIEVSLREIGWEAEDSLKSRDEIEAMISDIDSLRREAGMKKIDESFDPYGRFRRASIEYIEKKKTFRKYFDAAKESIEKQEDRKADELVASLKDDPKELKDAYQKVVDSYGQLCDALIAIIDTNRGGGDKVEAVGVSEVSKVGFGLIEGENLESYSKRMKSIGRAKDIPSTIRDIDEKTDKTERQWRSVAGISIDEFDTVKENWKRSVQGFMRKCGLASNMKIAEANRLVGGGRELPDNENGDGIIASNGNPVKQDIKYGCLHSITPTKKDNEIGDPYGFIVVRWKPNCVVATMTFGDSIDIENSESTFESPCLVTDASPCCFNPLKQDVVNDLKKGTIDIGIETVGKMFGIPYVELQFHGKGWYKPESVESISFWCEDDLKNLSQSAVEQIVKNKIPVFIKEEQVKIADYIEGFKDGEDDSDEMNDDMKQEK